jgi:hypothetical protein
MTRDQYSLFPKRILIGGLLYGGPVQVLNTGSLIDPDGVKLVAFPSSECLPQEALWSYSGPELRRTITYRGPEPCDAWIPREREGARALRRMAVETLLNCLEDMASFDVGLAIDVDAMAQRVGSACVCFRTARGLIPPKEGIHK